MSMGEPFVIADETANERRWRRLRESRASEFAKRSIFVSIGLTTAALFGQLGYMLGELIRLPFDKTSRDETSS